MDHSKHMKKAVCTVCDTLFKTRASSTAQTCSASCRGASQRQRSEIKYRLDAFDRWTPEMAYALGLIFSDGCITKPKQGSWRIQFTSTDKPQAQWFHDFLGNPHPLRWKQPKTKTIAGIPLRKTPQVQFLSTTVSDTLVQRLRDLGIRPRKSKEANGAMQISDEVVHFLRGVCDGDGSIMFVKNAKMPGGQTLRASIVCVPEKDRIFLSSLLEKLSVPHTVTSKTLRMDGSQAELFCKQLYAEAGEVCLTRKHDLWKRWIQLRSDHGGLITERDPYEGLRGLRPQPWHRWFGKLPDREIAKRVGLTKSAVARARKAAGFSPITPPKEIAVRSWHSLVGTMPDSHVAQRARISPATVFHYRKKKAIPVFPRTRTTSSVVASQEI